MSGSQGAWPRSIRWSRMGLRRRSYWRQVLTVGDSSSWSDNLQSVRLIPRLLCRALGLEQEELHPWVLVRELGALEREFSSLQPRPLLVVALVLVCWPLQLVGGLRESVERVPVALLCRVALRGWLVPV